MKFRRRHRREVSIEMTPLIDVVFLLLIFFMVSTTFIRQTQLKVELPEASAEVQELKDDVVEITVSANDTYAVNRQTLVDSNLKTLMRAIRKVSGNDAGKQLIITADANAHHESVVRVMDAAGQLGFTALSITTRNPTAEQQ